jgi:hypothetical protein
MNKLLGLNLRFHVNSDGKLKVNTTGTVCDRYVVTGFKIKVGKEKNYLFPILKIEKSKK